MILINALEMIEFALFGLVALVGITQLVIPLWRGTPMFPLLRRERKLESELEKARQAQVEENLDRRIDEVRPARRRSSTGGRRPPQ